MTAASKTARNIAVVTGTRADYGLLLPVIRAIDGHRRLRLQLVVAGMHLLRRFGGTAELVAADGWPIAARVPVQTARDSAVSQARGLRRGVSGFAAAFERLDSDMVVVLGDRLEAFAAAAAAVASDRILAHIHAGDTAPGINDESYRHAISKMAHLLFPATDDARARLLRMGEPAWRVRLVGSPAIDNLSDQVCRSAKKLQEITGLNVSRPFLIVLQHPAGAAAAAEGRRMTATLKACERKGLPVMVLYPNCDPGHTGIISAAERFCRRRRWPLITNLPRDVFLGLLRRAAALVGNSSAGLIEAGALNTDVVNVGPRQKNRRRGPNVKDCDYGTDNVSAALEAVLNRRERRRPDRIYGSGRSGVRIAAALAGVRIDERLRRKISSF